MAYDDYRDAILNADNPKKKGSGYDIQALQKVARGGDPLADMNAAVSEDLRRKEAPKLEKEQQSDWWDRELNRRLARRQAEGPGGFNFDSTEAPFNPDNLSKPTSYGDMRTEAEGSMYADQQRGSLASTTKPGQATNDPPPKGTPGVLSYDSSGGSNQSPRPNPQGGNSFARENPYGHTQGGGGGSGGGSGGGGSSTSAYRFAGQIGQDYDQQIAAMEREKAARKGEIEGGSGARSTMPGIPDQPSLEGPAITGNRAIAAQDSSQAYERQSRARDQYYEGRQKLEEIHKIVLAAASGKVNINPHISSDDRMAAMGAALMGHPDVAANIINSRIQQSIAKQQADSENQFRAAGHLENLWEMNVRNSKTQEEAYDKTYAALHGAELRLAENALLPYKGKQQEAQADEMIAAMRLQQHEVMARIMGSSQRGGAGTGQTPYIPLEQGATTVTTKEGQEYYIGKGGEKVVQAVEFSERAAEESRKLADMMNPDKIPNPLTDMAAYQSWVAAVREQLKSTSVIGAQHLATGGRGNVATMQAYSRALAGEDADPKGWWAAIGDYPRLTQGGVAKAIQQNARTFATSAEDDMHRILHDNGAIPGRTVITPITGAGEYKGMHIQKPMFDPRPPSAVQQQPQPSSGQNGGGNREVNTDWRKSFRPGN